MTLAAAQVIDAVAARLVPLAASGGRVYTDRTWPLNTLPAWRVTAEDEAVVVDTLDPVARHDLEIAARGVVAAVDAVDDSMHSLAAGGLALLFAPTVPYGLQLTGIGRDMQTDNGATVGVITLRMRATYFVAPAAPETIL